ncbi:ATP-binding protein [Patescibacteria group bacterium]|nr:ATP-binding protein [Patescibacteria group bacterium]
MDGLKVLEIIRKTNPWFKTNEVPNAQLEQFRRREFYPLKKELAHPDMATLIIGARRVGKSVLMYQLVDELLESGVEGKRVLFIQGDNPILTEYAATGSLINFILDLYQKYIIEEPFDELSKTIYIFIDEAQSLKMWDTEIKAIIDQKYRIKFVVTGSSSFELRRGSQNPLTGRVNIQPIFPFSFVDYANYSIKDIAFGDQTNKLGNKFRESLMSGNPEATYAVAKEAKSLIGSHKLETYFETYLFRGGFPRVIAYPGNDYHRYLRDLLTTTISKDIMTQVEIRDTQSFERLMVNLCLMAGQAIKYKNLADILGIDERSVIKYIDYYVESHWVFLSSPYMFHNRPDSVRTDKKVYIIDSGVINTLSFKDIDDFRSDKTHRGHILENVIHNHLLAYKQSDVGTFQSSIPFWIETETDKEIDFILEIRGGVLPIEVKLKVTYDENDESAIRDFLSKRQSAKFGILTTKDTLMLKENILLIPSVLFTLLL